MAPRPARAAKAALLALLALLALASAAPNAQAASVCAEDRAVESVAISQTSLDGNAQLVALVAGQVIYVCGWDFLASAAASVRFVYGTGTACATGETGLTGAYPVAANNGVVRANAGAVQAKTTAGQALCIETSTSINVHGLLTYVQRAP